MFLRELDSLQLSAVKIPCRLNNSHITASQAIITSHINCRNSFQTFLNLGFVKGISIGNFLD
jgi:hypothetical protein